MGDTKFKITYILGPGASANALPTVRATNSTLGYTNSLRLIADSISKNISNEVPPKKLIFSLSIYIGWQTKVTNMELLILLPNFVR